MCRMEEEVRMDVLCYLSLLCLLLCNPATLTFGERVSLNDALNVAFDKFQNGRIQEAQKITEEVISLQPNLAAAHNLLGIIHQDTNKPNLAVESFHRATVLDPDDADMLSNYGYLLIQLKRYKDAEIVFKKLTETHPSLSKGWNGLGIAAYHRITSEYLKAKESAFYSLNRAVELADPVMKNLYAGDLHNVHEHEAALKVAHFQTSSSVSSLPEMILKRPYRLAVIPSDPLESYEKKGRK